jgi:hypothetical protein
VALPPDQEQQFLYVRDGVAVDVVDRKSLELIGEIKPPVRRNAGAIKLLEQMR